MCRCPPSLDGGAIAGASVDAGIVTLWESDLTDQGDVIFADGALNLTGLDGRVLAWTIANTDRAAAGAIADWGLEDGVGLNWLANAVLSQWVPGTQNASRITIPTATLLSTFDLDFTATLLVELYFTLATLSSGNPDISIGFSGLGGTPNNSGDRMWATKRGLRAAAQVSLTETTAASSNYTSAPGPTADVLATMIQGNQFVGMIGNASVGPPFVWPQLRTIVTAGSPLMTAISTLTGTNLAVAFSNGNNNTATSRFRANRIRISAQRGRAAA